MKKPLHLETCLSIIEANPIMATFHSKKHLKLSPKEQELWNARIRTIIKIIRFGIRSAHFDIRPECLDFMCHQLATVSLNDHALAALHNITDVLNQERLNHIANSGPEQQSPDDTHENIRKIRKWNRI